MTFSHIFKEFRRILQLFLQSPVATTKIGLRRGKRLVLDLPWLLLKLLNPRVARIVLNLFSSNPNRYIWLAEKINIKDDLKLNVKAGPLQGCHFEDLLADEFKPILFGMESLCTNLLLKMDLSNSIVLDIGANYGYYSVLLSSNVKPSGIIYAFEPDMFTFIRLKRNLELNHCHNVISLPCAVSSKASVARWISYEKEPWANHLSDDKDGAMDLAGEQLGVIPVVTTSIDEFATVIPHNLIKLIKIDVEGAEVDVVVGADRLLKEVRPVLMIELHSRQNADLTLRILSDNRYLAYTVEFVSDERHHIVAIPKETEREYSSTFMGLKRLSSPY